MNSRCSRTSLAALATVALLITSGCKEKPTGITGGNGPFQGRWNGATWEGRGHAVLVNDTLHLWANRQPDPKVFYHEFVRVKIPFRGKGTYRLERGTAWLDKTRMAEAGQFLDATGELVVDRLKGKVIEGTISLQAASTGEAWSFDGGRFVIPVYRSFSDVP